MIDEQPVHPKPLAEIPRRGGVGTDGDRTVQSRIAGAAQMAAGSMKMARVGERRVVVIRTASGYHALDNACPHQGYGLVTGALDGELITCQWHNWKYRVTDGKCVVGEEDVACHAVQVDGDDVIVSVTEPTAEQQAAKLWPSLRGGIRRDYRGQIARDTARLLTVGATAEELLATGLSYGLPRAEWGVGHEMAVSADLLGMADDYVGIDKTLPLTHALTGMAESARGREPHSAPQTVTVPADRAVFLDALESEDWATAVGALRALMGQALTRPSVGATANGVSGVGATANGGTAGGATGVGVTATGVVVEGATSNGPIAAGATVNDPAIGEARSWFIDAVSRHHYSYGHGAIYTQKAFTLIERIPKLTDLLLSELALTLIYGTREDTLPYMRKANRAIDAVDLVALAATATPQATGWVDADAALLNELLDAEEAPIASLVDAAHCGAGVEGVLNTVSLAAAHRLLRYDLAIERNNLEEFGWLDMTHVLTYANAARWAWAQDPGPRSARLALLTAFLAFDSGRGERRNDVERIAIPDARPGDLSRAIIERRPEDAVAHALAGEPDEVADQLARASLEDTAGSFIVMAHLVKTAVAARAEAEATKSNLPLAASARFMAAPRTERFVTRAVREAIEFIQTGQPPAR